MRNVDVDVKTIFVALLCCFLVGVIFPAVQDYPKCFGNNFMFPLLAASAGMSAIAGASNFHLFADDQSTISTGLFFYLGATLGLSFAIIPTWIGWALSKVITYNLGYKFGWTDWMLCGGTPIL